jgi:hypothetical protein
VAKESSSYWSSILIHIPGGRSSLVGSINEILPTLAEICRRFSRQSFSVAVTWFQAIIMILDSAQPVGGRTAGFLSFVMCFLSPFRDRLLAWPVGARRTLQWREGG